MSIAVISDVHGCYKTLLLLLEKLSKKAKTICFVGDLIDRGPDSFSVVDFVIKNGFDCVKGNHEDIVLRSDDSLWMCNGGKTTLDSYIKNGFKYISEEHLTFFRSLPIIKIYEEEGLIVSHSSAAAYVLNDNDAKYEEWVLWDRPSHPKKIPGYYNVYGHTPRDNALIKEHFACIGTCCFAGNGLTALIYPEMEVVFEKSVDLTYKEIAARW